VKKAIVESPIVSAALCLCPIFVSGAETLQDEQFSEAALQHAKEILQSTPLIDGHNDLPWLIREENGGDVTAFRLDRENAFDTDIPRLRKGMVGAQFWSVWIPGETAPADTARMQLEQIDVVRQIIDMYPDTFELALSADDIERIFDQGKIASLLGMEGGYALNNSLGAMRAYYRLGVRYMTLTHNVTVDWADAGLGEQRHGGMTAFGRAVVLEMNRTGMMVDLAHTSPATMHQAIDVTQAPVIWSHAAAQAIVDHPRNVPDDILSRLPKNGGVVMVTFIPSFLSNDVWEMEKGLWATDAAIETVREYREKWLAYDAEHGAVRASINDVADHIEHIRDVAGVDHVGIGSDFWGMPDMPLGLEDVSGFPRLIAALIQRGWSDDELRKLSGKNMLRTMRRVEAVARELQKETPPSNVKISDLDIPK
jgi:membrane dipeptidase